MDVEYVIYLDYLIYLNKNIYIYFFFKLYII